MQLIKIYNIDNFIKVEETYEVVSEAYVIVGEPSDKLLEFQAKGYCVLAELKHLQGLRDEEIAEAICKEEAVTQYEHVCIDASQLPQAYFRRIWCRHIGEPVLIAETERLVIRESVEEDAKAFWELYQDEACGTYLEMPPVELCGDMKTDVAEYRQYIAQYREGQYAFFEYGMWSVVEKASGRCIGRAGLEMQGDVLCLGYAILPQYRGKGYATEACVAVLDYCKECEYAEEVFVNISEENIASKKVYEKVRAERDILKKIQ